MEEIISLGTVSSRGQIALPAGIRREMGLQEGEKVLFLLEDDVLLMKRISKQTFAEITAPLKKAAKDAGFKESDVVDIVHQARKSK